MLNEDLNNQTDDMLSQDSEKDRITQALLKEREGFKLRPTEDIIDKAKATGTGLLTGTLAIPSDLVTLSSAVASGVAKYSDNPTAMMLKDVLQKAEKEVGREAFDKWFTKTTGIESTPDNVDQLIGEILSPTGAFLAPVKTLKKVFAPLKKGVTDFFDKMPPPDGGLALETAGATKPVGQLDQTQKLLDQEKAVTTNIPSSIPADEIVNAPTINPTMAGMNTATGKKQAKLFEELEAKGNTTPEELFQETGVYRGQDGKLRYEIDDRNAKFVKNFKPEVGETYSLSKVLKFDDLYKEYFENVKVTSPDVSGVSVFGALRNVPIKFIDDANKKFRGEYTASYSPTVDFDLSRKVDDFITINLNPFKDILDPVKKRESIISTLLHEVQHAVQRREGFRTGGSASGELIKSPKYNDYLQAKKTVENSETRRKQYVEDNLEDEIKPNIFNKKQKDDFLKNIDNEIMLLSEYSLKPKERKDLNQAIIQGYDDILSKIPGYKENKENAHLYFAKYLQSKIQKATNKTADQSLKYISNYIELHKSDSVAQDLILREEAIAREKYRRLYGEREAKLVQERFERRMKYKEIYGDVSELDMRLETDFLKGEQSNLGQMGGFKKGQIEIETDNINNVSQSVDILEKTPVKKSPALQKISEITKLRDGTLGSRTPMDKDGLPKNLIRDKDGKPLILYYGDMGKVYDPVTQTYKPTPSGIPGKLTNKFLPSGRTYTTDKKIGNFVTPNPIFASGYASQEGGSVIPVYIIADKVTNIKASSFMDIDKAGGDAKRGEVFVGDVGYDSAPPVKVVDGREVKDLELRDESIKKYGTKQYTFNKGTQVFSAITGERLTELPTIKQNIKNKLLNLSKKEEDIMLKNLSPEDRLKYKNIKTGGDETDDFDEEFINDLFYMFRDMDLKKNLEKRNLAKGGDMKKQMDLFQEGGLKDEGGTVDPVSGNDVPPGSTQEEVRDDIPAQLSEGEFVFPADVVRFLGLNFLMELRQKAKAGLKRMEEMGQMGNSDEATLPDDIPFTIDDLDMEDEEEYNTDTEEMNQGGMVRVGGVEMPKPRIAGQQLAEGGVVKAQTGTFVAPGSGVTTVPSQFAGQNLPSYKPTETIQSGTRPAYTVPIIPAPTTGFRKLPIAQTGQQQTGQTPSFQDLLGKDPGQYDELREYVNDAGMKLKIPFKNGQPIYPIPEGYKFVDPEEEQTETPTVQTTQTKTTTTTGEGGDDTGARVGTTMVGKTGKSLSQLNSQDIQKSFGTMSTSQRGLTVMDALDKAKGQTGLARGLQQFATAVTPGVLAAKMVGQKTFDPRDVLSQVGRPDTKDLNSVLNAFGPSTVGLTPEEIDMQGIDRKEALSQAIYGMSYAEATKTLGVAPTFTKGHKNGQIDPQTGATYSFGQATDDDGNISYSDFGAFSNAMTATGRTGFMGGVKAAERVSKTGKTEKARNRAKSWLTIYKGLEKKDEDKEKGKYSYTFGYDESQGTDPGDTPTDTSISDVGSEEDPGTPDYGYDFGASVSDGQSSDDDGSTDAVGGDEDEGESPDADDDPEFKQGGLAKRKTKVKKMKRGGLASR